MGYIDIIVLVLVAALVASRFLGFNLPKDPRDSAARKAEFEKLFGRRKASAPSKREAYPAEATEFEDAEATPARRKVPKALAARDVAHLAGLEQIKALDTNFDQADFLSGAIAAYGYFYECSNARDQTGIINLCGPELEQRIMAEWQSNPAQVVLEAEPTAKIMEARLNGRTAIIEVAFSASQRVGKAGPKLVKSSWVFARALGSADPNWELQSISDQADA